MLEKYKVSVKSFRKNGKSLIGNGRTYDVVVGQQELKNVKAFHSQCCDDCKCCSNCPYYFNEHLNYSPHIFCLDFYSRVYNVLFCLTFMGFFIKIFSSMKYSSIPILLLVLITSYFVKKLFLKICNSIEGIAIIYEMHKEKKRDLTIENNFLDYSSANSYLVKISSAKAAVDTIKSLFESQDFKSCSTSIQECITLLDEIIKIIENDSSVYPRAAYLFEAGLPELQDVLTNFLKLVETDCANVETEKKLNSTLSIFLKYTERIKKETLLNSSEDMAKINFEASNNFIQTWLDLK